MAKMARILGRKDSAAWRREAERSRQAMDRVLWDKRKNWYGVLHEDRTLDTRVGVDGLFPLAYALPDRAKARLARRNFERLLGPHGTYTLAPGERGHYEETYWRGPAWPKSCSVAMAAACRYYPDLKGKVKDGLVNFLLRYPSVWECISARTGKIARGDMGLMAMPVVSSNVGAEGKVKDGLVNFLLRYPSVWECMSARTGKIARGDMGLMAHARGLFQRRRGGSHGRC